MTQIQNSKQVIRLQSCPTVSSPAELGLRSDAILLMVNVLVIEYWNLEFICNLMLVICYFQSIRVQALINYFFCIWCQKNWIEIFHHLQLLIPGNPQALTAGSPIPAGST
jgi:hypothetical protein